MHKEKSKVYAFIDSQNLLLGTKNDIRRNGKIIYFDWSIDLKKFRIYLKDKYKVEKAFIFLGKISGMEKLYSSLEKYGYEIVFKPTIKYKKDGKFVYKGNVDVELSVYAIRNLSKYDSAVIVTGDGDFLCLLDVLNEEHKLKKVIIPNRYAYSSLLFKYRNRLDFISDKKMRLEK